MFKNQAAIFLLMYLVSPTIQAIETAPRFAVSYNVLETLGFLGASKLVGEDKLIYLPFHIDAHYKIRDWLSLSMALVYRFESYQDDGPLYSDSGNIRAKQLWTNFNEIFLLFGPRFSPFKTGLEAFYISSRAGLGTAISPLYHNLSLLTQLELGYSFVFSNPGFYLTLGAGVLFNVPIYENIEFAVPWKSGYQSMSSIGLIVHQAIPILNLSVGLNW
jgi:hypothetical protein